jgi:acyl carrier protein phosphodiesterase
MYYMGIHDPDRLSDEEWAARYREMDYLRGVEAKINSKMLSNRL